MFIEKTEKIKILPIHYSREEWARSLCGVSGQGLNYSPDPDKVNCKNCFKSLKKFDGKWFQYIKFTKTCSGCFNSTDGHPDGEYPIDKKHNCYIGSGCPECGFRGKVRVRDWQPLEGISNE